MKLESSYIRTTALGKTRPTRLVTPALGLTPAEQYRWGSDGKCINTVTGVPYPGDQKLSNCQTLHGPYKTPTGKGAVYDFLKNTFLEGGQQGSMPQASVTGSSLLVPAVVVVGGVALLLILTRKK